jgi:hypothetical protein
MRDMSQGIRMVIQHHAPDGTLSSLPTEILIQFIQIVGAFYGDLQAELERR